MKIRLRPGGRPDGKYLLRWIGDERQLRMWSRDRFDYPLTREQMDAYYDGVAGEPDIFSFIAVNEKGIPVGSLQLSVTSWENNTVHMGFIIVSPQMRGQGLGQKMVSLAVEYAVRILGMNTITLKVFDSNPQARHCYEKAGFLEEEYKKEDFLWNGESWGNSLMAYRI